MIGLPTIIHLFQWSHNLSNTCFVDLDGLVTTNALRRQSMLRYYYGRSLEPNIMDLWFSFCFLSYLLSWLIRFYPFSLMTATLSSYQACTCPLPHVVHNFHFTLVLCTPMLLISFTTCLMLTFHFSLRKCLLLGCAWCTPPMHVLHKGCTFSLPFCHCRAVASCHSSISWLCLMHAPNSCYLHT